MKVGFYAGSFDPFTNGHLEIAKKASKIFDKVIVAIGTNPSKKRRYEIAPMILSIEKCLKNNNLKNVIVISYEGLTIEEAKKYNSTYLIRGIRNGMDYAYEENIASINEELSSIDTIYFRAGAFGIVSSSMVYELLMNKKDVSKYVPKEINELIKNA